MTFSEIFPNIWAASAFKGAFGETLIVPNAKMHLENNQAWLEVGLRLINSYSLSLSLFAFVVIVFFFFVSLCHDVLKVLKNRKNDEARKEPSGKREFFLPWGEN